jgi:hypothetical protein
MTLALALIMIVIIGAMGAGLLAFVNRDLYTVIEENKGQRAFEMADAGIAAAKRQLASSVDRTKYNGDNVTSGTCGSDDYQWSALRCGTPKGLTLNNLDGDAATADSVNVTIEYQGVAGDPSEYFKVISIGTFGNAKRKIEAIFKGVPPNAQLTDLLGHPLYYTPSSIKIEATTTTQDQVDLKDISLFSGKDILVQGELDQAAFRIDMSSSNAGVLKRTGTADALGNWYSPGYPLDQGRGPWNTQVRKENSQYSGQNSSNDLLQPGLAAVGKICGFNAGAIIGRCPSTSQSIADGVYAYDCTTGPVDLPESVCTSPPLTRPNGNNLTFVNKQPQDQDPNDTDTITFPFPRLDPIPGQMYANTTAQGRVICTTNPCAPDFPTIFRNVGGQNPRVFVDAGGRQVNFSANGNPQGVLIIWCGRLVQQSSFTGIIMNLKGDGSAWGGSNCSSTADTLPLPTEDLATFRNEGQQFSGWLYAAGGNDQRAGIEIGPGSTVRKYPGQDWNLLNNNEFQSPPPTSFALNRWRELYQ